MITYTWTDTRLNYTGNAALKVSAFTMESKCVQYYQGDLTSKCKKWSDEMLPPPTWSPTFEFEGLAQGMDTTMTDIMKIEKGVMEHLPYSPEF